MCEPEQASRPVPTSQWVASLATHERDALVEKLRLVQSWINDFAQALGKKRPPRARIAEIFTYYTPWANVIAIPARTLLRVDEHLLRIAVAHECGHFNRRWASLLSRSDVARLGEEVLADRVAMHLTGATLDELDAAVRGLAELEGGWEGAPPDEYIALRRELLGTQSKRAAGANRAAR